VSEPRFLTSAPIDPPPGPLFGVAVSDDDRFIAVAQDNGLVAVWQRTLAIPTPTFVGRGHRRSVRAVAFAPSGSRDDTCLVSGSLDCMIRTWHLGDSSRNAVLLPHDSSVMCLAFDPAGTRLISGSEDRTIAISSWPDGKLERRWVAHGSVLSVAVAPSGKSIASGGSDGGAYLWSLAGDRLARIDDDSYGLVWSVRFLDDERIVYSKGPRAIEWTPRGSRTLYTFDDPLRSLLDLAVRGDGEEIAIAAAHQVITVRVADARVQRRSEHHAHVNRVAYLSDGHVASTADDGTLLVSRESDLWLRAASA
jgi:hypothetical protein